MKKELIKIGNKSKKAFSFGLNSKKKNKVLKDYCNLIKKTIIAAKKVAPSETKKSTEKKDNINKGKTIAEIDRDKLEKKFSKKKTEKLNLYE